MFRFRRGVSAQCEKHEVLSPENTGAPSTAISLRRRQGNTFRRRPLFREETTSNQRHRGNRRARTLRRITERRRLSPYGSISVIRRRRDMENAVKAELGFLTRDLAKFDFFGMYDGHGGLGEGDGESFRKMDEQVEGRGRRRMWVRRRGRWGRRRRWERRRWWLGIVEIEGRDVARSAQPDRPDELERIESAGRRVINWNGSRVLGVLATSIWDHYLKPFAIPKAQVKVIERNSTDEFLILASDGLVSRCDEAAAALAEPAVARGSRDNISVVVVDLNRTGKCTV
ncbi:hypothetical protein Acr_02g0000860 [Actinidia rufa]|uniref:protein-serine/threonine phosphatase n=1 Tax=Actinidia rufa TaxID=165716 RepID=A0A7J0E6M0_9ERIC|nr:hypothetical protein Acr_02g0000860 [Actinidia rufa]